MGGLVSPAMDIAGYSWEHGPVASCGDLSHFKRDEFDPADFFNGAALLGGIELKDILDVVTGLGNPNVPKFSYTRFPTCIETKFEWVTVEIHSRGIFSVGLGGNQTKLKVIGKIKAPFDPSVNGEFSVTASLSNFSINLFGFITVGFDKLAFDSKNGAKPGVTADLHSDGGLIFGGPLEFVSTLLSFIPMNGFAKLPSLSISPGGISIGYGLSLPLIGFGVFVLDNVSLGSTLEIPFDGSPVRLWFNFAERQTPFSLTVSCLGGGGFFGICVSARGVEELETALEFGAQAAVNLGVASGSVEVKGGIYFHWQNNCIELAGYVRMHGEMSVLGLISTSLTFLLQLTYMKKDKQSILWGEAKLSVEIDLWFFSAEVTVRCRREFAGSEADPKFVDLIPDQKTWDGYCAAFAEEA